MSGAWRVTPGGKDAHCPLAAQAPAPQLPQVPPQPSGPHCLPEQLGVQAEGDPAVLSWQAAKANDRRMSKDCFRAWFMRVRRQLYRTRYAMGI